jgi:uncharacterized protein YegL
MAAAAAVIEAAYDIELHTLVKQSPTIGCVRITTPATLVDDVTLSTKKYEQNKTKQISLIVIADASGSMESGDRMANMRTGIMRLHELSTGVHSSSSSSKMNVELSVIKFSDSAELVYGPANMPTEDELQRVCMDINPQGGTNMGMAIELALSIAEEESEMVSDGKRKSVHIVLFTDGVDTSSLRTKLESKQTTTTTAVFIQKLKTLKRLTLHCVGICSDADASVLDTLVRESRRGTFQCIKDNDISKLMSCMWGLMMEMIDENVRLVVEIYDDNDDDDKSDTTTTTSRQLLLLLRPTAVVSRDVILRVCDPPIPLVVGFKIPNGNTTTMLRARMVIEDRCIETRIDLPRVNGPAFDMVCAKEAVNLLQGELNEKIIQFLRAGNPADAVAEIDITREVLQSMLDKTTTTTKTALDDDDESFSAIVDTVMTELALTEADMIRILDDLDQARDAELRAMSRSATARNSCVSIVPDGATLSALQRELSSGGGAY